MIIKGIARSCRTRDNRVSNHPARLSVPLLLSHSPRLPDTRMMLSGLTGSSSISISVEPNAPRSTIAFGSVYRLKLLPLFNPSGRYVCDTSLSIPTRGGFYTCNISLECSHTHENAEVVLGSDWISACSATLCDDRVKLEDPTEALIASLPAGHYWSSDNGMLVT